MNILIIECFSEVNLSILLGVDMTDDIPVEILVVDDDTNVREAIVRILKRAGYTVHKGTNGREGLEILASTECDMLITDIIMPEMEGIEVIGTVRQQYPHIKIIAMSGGGRSKNTDFLKIAKQIGACDTIYKPTTATALLETVHKNLPPFG